jgi:hypothetical protein
MKKETDIHTHSLSDSANEEIYSVMPDRVIIRLALLKADPLTSELAHRLDVALKTRLAAITALVVVISFAASQLT